MACAPQLARSRPTQGGAPILLRLWEKLAAACHPLRWALRRKNLSTSSIQTRWKGLRWRATEPVGVSREDVLEGMARGRQLRGPSCKCSISNWNRARITGPFSSRASITKPRAAPNERLVRMVSRAKSASARAASFCTATRRSTPLHPGLDSRRLSGRNNSVACRLSADFARCS